MPVGGVNNCQILGQDVERTKTSDINQIVFSYVFHQVESFKLSNFITSLRDLRNKMLLRTFETFITFFSHYKSLWMHNFCLKIENDSP